MNKLAHHHSIQELAIVGINKQIIPGTTVVSFDGLMDWLAAGPAIWFEPARHYWWRPALIRQGTGRKFPIISMMHSIGYSYQIEPLIASLATPRHPQDTIIASSEASAKAFREQCASIIDSFGIQQQIPHVTVIPYGVPPIRRVSKPSARHLLQWDETARILFIGRLSLQDKADFDALLEASARLKSSGVNFKLVIAGADVDQGASQLRTKTQEYGLEAFVDIHANVSEVEKHVLLSASDIFVSPSNTVSESFGLSIIEAMLHSCPVVCSSWSGYREIVRDKIDGFLIDTWWDDSSDIDLQFIINRPKSLSLHVAIDIHHLEQSLKLLITNQELRKTMGDEANARAEKLFTIENTVNNIVNLIKDKQPIEWSINERKKIYFVKSLGDYATYRWTGKESHTPTQSIDLQRILRTGHQKELAYLKQFTEGSGKIDNRNLFRLLRCGLLQLTEEYPSPSK